MDSWDDLRFLLAVARTGTTRGAADALGVNQSTVSRRLAQLERGAGVRLLARHPDGLKPTDAGRDMVEIAETIAADFERLGRQVLGRDDRISGPLRFTLPDFMVGPLGPALAGFARTYPEVDLEVMVENGYVSLTHREADMALRLTRKPDDQLVGRRLAGAAVAVYASPTYLDRLVDEAELATLDWIRWEERWRQIPPERWIDRHVARSRVRARVNTSLAMAELAASGLGAAFHLCFTGDADPRLRRVSQPFAFDLSMWLLTHDDLRGAGRVRALMACISDALTAQRAQLEQPRPLGPVMATAGA